MRPFESLTNVSPAPVSKEPATPLLPQSTLGEAGCTLPRMLVGGEQGLTPSTLPFWEPLGLPPVSHFGGALSPGFGPTTRAATE